MIMFQFDLSLLITFQGLNNASSHLNTIAYEFPSFYLGLFSALPGRLKNCK